MSGTIVILTGPSCAGKSTLEAALTKEPGFRKIISHTTRAPRPGEVDGREYYFVSREEFDRMHAACRFVEVVEFNGNKYGAARQQFIDAIASGRSVVVVVEPNGRDEILQFADEMDLPALPVFITNPADVIAERFMRRVFEVFATNIVTHGVGGSADFAAKDGAKRLDAMLSEETTWRAADHPNAVTFGRFDEQNAELVKGRVISMAQRVAQHHNKAAFESA